MINTPACLLFKLLKFSIFVFMTLEGYITDLLYRYQCVVVPDFGAFLSQIKPASLQRESNTFYPPYKELSFNARLHTNDGLLVAQVAQAEADMAEAQVEVMQGALSAAQARLDKATNGATELEIQMAEVQVDQALASLDIIELIRPAARRYLLGAMAASQTQVEIAELQLGGVEEGTAEEDMAAAQAAVTQATSDLQAARGQFSQAEAQELVAQAEVRTAEAEAEQARAQVEVAKAQVQQAQAALSTLKAGSREEDIAAATADVTAATAALTSAKNALEDATLKALFYGTVGAVQVDEGELVQPADPVITLGDLSLFRAETDDLSEVDIVRIQVGQQAAVTVDALDGQVFLGTVSRIAPLATEVRGDTVYKISLDLDTGSNQSLRWGMTAFVEIDTDSPPEKSSVE